MTKYTITDGRTTIVFQSMIHIAAPDFYLTVEKDIKNYTSTGYIFLYEGITPSKNPNKNNDNGADIPDFSYIASLVGLTSQNDGDYFNIATKLGYNADVDEDWIIERFSKLISKEQVKEKPNKEQRKYDSKDIKNKAEENKNLIAFVFLPLSRIGSRFSDIENYFSETTNSYDPETKIIIVDRNTVLLENVEKAEELGYKKIYINYGADHFINFFHQLKAENNNWHIIAEENYTAY